MELEKLTALQLGEKIKQRLRISAFMSIISVL